MTGKNEDMCSMCHIFSEIEKKIKVYIFILHTCREKKKNGQNKN